jgi:hypothetical protein
LYIRVYSFVHINQLKMKRNLNLLAIAGILALGGIGCAKEVKESKSPEVSQEVIGQIRSLGFSTDKVAKVPGGYLVEGDIVLTPDNLTNRPSSPTLIVAQEEQYRTYNLVSASKYPNIVIKLNNSSAAHQAAFSAALDESIRRYNAESLTIKFVRNDAATSPNITLVAFYENSNVLGSSGFPTATGEPYNQVRMNTFNYGTGTDATNINYIGTIITHEIGHTIGFRHTDYMNRSYSCGFSFPNNEGASTVGAVLIPGTPKKADPNSFMLACIGTNVNRPFNANDKTALAYLY